MCSRCYLPIKYYTYDEKQEWSGKVLKNIIEHSILGNNFHKSREMYIMTSLSKLKVIYVLIMPRSQLLFNAETSYQ